MSAALALVEALERRGVRLIPDGERLRVAPASRLSPAELEAVRQSKEELLGLLRDRDLGAALPFSGQAVEPREQLGAVLLRSPDHGEVWVVLADAERVRADLVAEERQRETRGAEPRPVLLLAEVARMRGMDRDLIRALLNVRVAFAGAEVVQ